MKIAVFPGSFDPITKGHESIVKRAAPLFDKIIVAIGVNSSKKGMFDHPTREQWIKETFADVPNVEVMTYSGLTVDFCIKQEANYILRGLRSNADFEYEFTIAQMNKLLKNNVETFFLLTEPEYSAISSTIVKDIYRNNGDVSQFVPAAIKLTD
ncbi:MAG: pantetheine-phosphate adenylyltransferase [Flavobacteriales bacterium]|jgi:pantetheine-phosphate adenylyltransferase|nr:pantetheine-phosphate adenylyltransferase [Flavobacteriales bacterium]